MIDIPQNANGNDCRDEKASQATSQNDSSSSPKRPLAFQVRLLTHTSGSENYVQRQPLEVEIHALELKEQ